MAERARGGRGRADARVSPWRGVAREREGRDLGGERDRARVGSRPTTSSIHPPVGWPFARRGDDEDARRDGRRGGARGREDGGARARGPVRRARAGARCARAGARRRATTAKTPRGRRRSEGRGWERDRARGGTRRREVREESRAGVCDVTAERGDERWLRERSGGSAAVSYTHLTLPTTPYV